MKKMKIRFETIEEFKERTLEDMKKLEEGELEPERGASFDPNNLPSAFTKKRIEILMKVNNKKFKSIKKLAETLNRDYKSVYQDVKALGKMGFLELNKKGKAKSRVEISMPYDQVILDFRNTAET